MNPLIYSLPLQHLSRQALTDLFPMHVPFVPNSFPITAFWCFMGVEKGCIGNKWVKIGQFFSVVYSVKILIYLPIFHQYSTSLPHGNIRKPQVFYFQGVYKWNIGWKWINHDKLQPSTHLSNHKFYSFSDRKFPFSWKLVIKLRIICSRWNAILRLFRISWIRWCCSLLVFCNQKHRLRFIKI